MRFATAVLFSLSACVTTATAVAHADTITIASQEGITTYTQISGHGSGDGQTGPATGYQHPAYAAPIAGSQWVSTDSNGGDGLQSVTNYSDQFMLQPDQYYSGSLTFMADDTVGVLVNGVQVFSENDYPSFYGPITIDLLPSYFQAGLNTITVVDTNNGGPAAADYAGTLQGSAITPEPSSLVLLGTGALSTAAAMRRRMRVA